jgi:hypothetical protein
LCLFRFDPGTVCTDFPGCDEPLSLVREQQV